MNAHRHYPCLAMAVIATVIIGANVALVAFGWLHRQASRRRH